MSGLFVRRVGTITLPCFPYDNDAEPLVLGAGKPQGTDGVSDTGFLPALDHVISHFNLLPIRVSEAAGHSSGHIGQMHRAKRLPSSEVMTRYANVFGLTVGELLRIRTDVELLKEKEPVVRGAISQHNLTTNKRCKKRHPWHK